MKTYDLAIIGMGSMGMSAAYYSALKGASVLGIEQYTSPHNNGSHNGQTRIIRKAYFEHPNYVPLLERAYSNWTKIEKLSGTKLYYKTGLNYFGLPNDEMIRGVKYASKQFQIKIASHSENSFFNLPSKFESLFEPEAGFVLPEKTITVLKKLALAQGLTLQENTKFLNYRPKKQHVEILTNNGSYYAKKVLLTVGAGIKSLLPSYEQLFKITQQALAWIEVSNPDKYSIENFSCWNIALPDNEGLFYGFPYLKNDIVKQQGIKLAHHFPDEEIDPNKRNKAISNKQLQQLKNLIEKYITKDPYKILRTCTCLYTNSRDLDFVIDYLPGSKDNIIIASGFSGHGFKFVPGIGELLAEMAIDNYRDPVLAFLSLERLTL